MHKISEKGEKCWSVFPQAQDDYLKYIVLSTTQKYAVYCYRGARNKKLLLEIRIKELLN